MRVLLGVVVLPARDRDLRERGEREAELERVLRAVGDVAALERARAASSKRPSQVSTSGDAKDGTAREERVSSFPARACASPSWRVASEPSRS